MAGYRGDGPKAKRVVVRTPDGTGSVLTRSQLEASILNDLTKRRVWWEYECEQLAWEETHVYTPDITLTKQDGSKMHIECKGYFTPQDRSKMLHIKKQHPEADLRFVFQRGQTKLGKGSKTTYHAWARKYGFPVAEGRVPTSWTTE